MKEIVFFSHNIHKIKEVKSILKSKKIKILTLTDFPKIISPKENGHTFNENAVIKSNFGYDKFCLPCFSDDSGICISALNNQPGIYSKRFQKENGGYKKTFKIIINKAQKKNNFKAFFQTSIALTTNKKNTKCFEGIVSGKISEKPVGSYGFHYDPIFIPNGTNKTYAQMSVAVKNTFSHRARALIKLKNYLDDLFY